MEAELLVDETEKVAEDYESLCKEYISQIQSLEKQVELYKTQLDKVTRNERLYSNYLTILLDCFEIMSTTIKKLEEIIDIKVKGE